MAEVPAVVDEKAEGKRRGHYQVSARLAKVLTLLASGEAKTQVEACEAAGMTPRALQLAMKKPSVRAYLQQVVMTSLGLSAAKAAKRMDELLHSSNEMVSFNASRFALGAGAGVVMPQASGPSVNIAIGERAGFIIDLRSAEEKALPLTAADQAALEAAREGAPGATLRGYRGAAPARSPVVIDAEATPIDDTK